MKFLGTVVAATIGALIAAGIILVFGFLMLMAVVAAGSVGAEPSVRQGSVLKLNLTGSYPEQAGAEVLPGFSSERSMTLLDVLSSIRKAKHDDRIDAIWLRPSGVGGSFSSLEEIRNELQDFTTSGKPLIASSISAGFSEADYFLASAADSVIMPPESYFEMNGFALQIQFLGGLMDKLDVEPQIVRAGNYKSAVEPFLRKDLSPENEEQLTRIVEVFASVFADEVSESRPVDAEQIRGIQDTAVPLRSAEAQSLGLVDLLAYEDEVESLIQRVIDGSPTDDPSQSDPGDLDSEEEADEADLQTVSLAGYSGVSARSAGIDVGTEGSVAVVNLGGMIVDGSAPVQPVFGGQVAASSDFVKTMDEVRDNKNIDAVVLRIDSGGGSASASDVMWHAVKRCQEKKPVVVSMSGTAASGGYYVAAPGDMIVASPTTITGSIGVFSMFFNVGPAMEDKLGITWDVVKSSPAADMFTASRGMTSLERTRLQADTEKTYATFLNRVADGRPLETDEVRPIAGGRVWTGLDAKDLGLVDKLGGIRVAIEEAATRAGLGPDEYYIQVFPRPKTVFEQVDALLRRGVASVFSPTLPVDAGLKSALDMVERVWQLQAGPQALLPIEITVR